MLIPFPLSDVTLAGTRKMMGQSFVLGGIKCYRLASQVRHHFCGKSGKVMSEIQTQLQEKLQRSNSCM